MVTFIVSCFSLRGRICSNGVSLGIIGGLQLGCALCAEAGQVDKERTSLADCTLYPDASVVEFYDLAADEQTEACSTDGAGG